MGRVLPRLFDGLRHAQRRKGEDISSKQIPFPETFSERFKKACRNPVPNRIAACFYCCYSVSAAFEGFHALGVVQNPLADAEILRGDLQKLVVGQKFQALLQA